MENSNYSQDSQSALIHVHGHSRILALSLTILCPLLAVIFIFLFFKLLCRSHIMVQRYETSNYSSNTTMQKNQHDGIDAKEIHSISIELFEGETGSDTQCSVCLGDLADGDKVKVMPLCNHVFHPECIDMWLSSHSSCPLCRASLISRPVSDLGMPV
ncbi:RING-H2 finger protein ATL66 [Rhynchospora pubera]|uniref:RING-H2 finger protein ATL66 n=1 Tax=Rhynchospora pubera TaxID=906938 RepID=A0AAV8DIA2_9POAL|nr:RING-H2 finger protein ATL66 [Rhynchospora pubera]